VDRRRFTAGARSVGTQFGFENIASDLIEADDAARKLSVAIQKYIDKGAPLVDATQDFSISTLMSGKLGEVFDKLPPKFKHAFKIGIEGLSAGDLEKRVLQSGGTSEFVSEAAVRGGLGAVLLILGSTADRANAALNEWISTIISSTQTVSQATTAIFGVQTGRLGARQQFAANTGGTFNLDKFAQLFEKQQAELTRGLGVGGGLDPRSLGATARSLQNDIEVSKNILSGTAKLSNQDREAERQSLDSNFSKLERVNSALGRLANSTSLLSAAQEKLAREQDFNQFKSTIADIFTLGTPKERRNAAEGAITLGRFNSEFVSGRGLQFLDSLSARRKEIFRGFINLLPAKQQEEFKERQAEALGVPFETGAANEVLTLQLRAADAQEEAAKIQLQAANLQAVVANQKIEDAEQKIRLIPIRKPKYGYREPGDTLPRFPGDPFPSISEKKNSGGRLSGFGSRDTVPAMLTPGEFVINAGATRNNLGILQAINSGQNFARGGRVERQEREERRIARGERIKES